jgi:hypothetical protein
VLGVHATTAGGVRLRREHQLDKQVNVAQGRHVHMRRPWMHQYVHKGNKYSIPNDYFVDEKRKAMPRYS